MAIDIDPKLLDTVIQKMTKITSLGPEAVTAFNGVKEALGQVAAAGTAHLGKLKSEFERVLTEFASGKLKADGFKDAIASLGTKANEVLKDLAGGFGGFISLLKTSEQLIGDLSNSLGGLSNENKEMVGHVTASIGAFSKMLAMPQGFADLSSEAQRFASVYSGMIDHIGKLPLAGAISEGMKTMFEKAEYAKVFENKLMDAAAKSGTFFEIAGGRGLALSLENMDTQLTTASEHMVKVVSNAAGRMGVPIQKEFEAAFKLMESIPGAFDEKMTLHGQAVDALTAFGVVARGTGRDQSEMMDAGKQLFALWNNTAKESITSFVAISMASNELKIPFDKLKDSVMSMEEGFKMWGSSSKGVLSVLKEVNDVLVQQGLGWSASLEITQKLAGSIKDMGIEKKSFLAMGAGLGGGSALKGGLEVEQMIQGGQWEKVLPMLQSAIGNIGGGRVLNLNEAVNTPGAESTFMAQRQLLGQMTGITDAGSANRLMDVMSQIQLGTSGAVDQQKALEDAFQKGENIQTRQYNVLIDISNKLDVLSILSTFKGRDMQRAAAGEEGAITNAIYGAGNRTSMARYEEIRREREGGLGSFSERGETLERIVGGDMAAGGQAIINGVKEIPAVMSGLMSRLAPGLAEREGKLEYIGGENRRQMPNVGAAGRGQERQERQESAPNVWYLPTSEQKENNSPGFLGDMWRIIAGDREKNKPTSLVPPGENQLTTGNNMTAVGSQQGEANKVVVNLNAPNIATGIMETVGQVLLDVFGAVKNVTFSSSDKQPQEIQLHE